MEYNMRRSYDFKNDQDNYHVAAAARNAQLSRERLTDIGRPVATMIITTTQQDIDIPSEPETVPESPVVPDSPEPPPEPDKPEWEKPESQESDQTVFSSESESSPAAEPAEAAVAEKDAEVAEPAEQHAEAAAEQHAEVVEPADSAAPTGRSRSKHDNRRRKHRHHRVDDTGRSRGHRAREAAVPVADGSDAMQVKEDDNQNHRRQPVPESDEPRGSEEHTRRKRRATIRPPPPLPPPSKSPPPIDRGKTYREQPRTYRQTRGRHSRSRGRPQPQTRLRSRSRGRRSRSPPPRLCSRNRGRRSRSRSSRNQSIRGQGALPVALAAYTGAQSHIGWEHNMNRRPAANRQTEPICKEGEKLPHFVGLNICLATWTVGELCCPDQFTEALMNSPWAVLLVTLTDAVKKGHPIRLILDAAADN